MVPGQFRATWTFFLEPLEGGHTRLIERFRIATPMTGQIAEMLGGFMGLGVFVMVRRQLLGIQARVEGRWYPQRWFRPWRNPMSRAADRCDAGSGPHAGLTDASRALRWARRAPRAAVARPCRAPPRSAARTVPAITKPTVTSTASCFVMSEVGRLAKTLSSCSALSAG